MTSQNHNGPETHRSPPTRRLGPIVGLALLCLGLLAGLAGAAITGPTYIIPEPVTGAGYGDNASLNGDTLVIGASQEGSAASGQGAAYGYRLEATSASSLWRIESPSPVPNERFGEGVSVYDDVLAVGSTVGQFGVAGSIPIYSISTGTPVLDVVINAPAGIPLEHTFGTEVEFLSGSELVASAYGTVFVFELAGGSWSETARFTSSQSAWGWSLSVDKDGESFVVGSLQSSSPTVSFFERTGPSWSETVIPAPTGGTTYDGFGRSVSLDGDALAVSAGRYPCGSCDEGRALLYERSSGIWTLTREIAAPGGDIQFGRAVAIEGDVMVIGSVNGQVYSVEPAGSGPVSSFISDVGVGAMLASSDWFVVPTTSDDGTAVVDRVTAPSTVELLATADSYVRSGSKNKNYGTETTTWIRGSGGRKTVVQFDQDAITNAVGTGALVSATLELNAVEGTAGGWSSSGRLVGAYRLTHDWVETGVTWNCGNDPDMSNSRPDCPGEAWEMNQNQAFSWLDPPTDQILFTNDTTGTVSWDVTDDVQAFLAGADNRGWIVRKEHDGQSGKIEFHTKESSEPPILVLEIDG
ncbi:MAG: DNRLRE domain-containing protein [Actinomycetia bacterium]|nr:DNRLRE domain-containing protein [Actinomycetes bacterium]MCP4961672.1 DNRLRE domain-containing protein [Actinomycetes bacterium]